MIHNLHIRNIALIDELEIDFSGGLNVLSGETGAGKTIIINALNLISGERADKELIRSGSDKARVEALLYPQSGMLDDLFLKYDIAQSEELIVSRELSSAGKSSCRINGSMVTLAVLKEFMDRLIDIHGQHEHQSLLDKKNHIGFIDGMAGPQAQALKGKIAEAHAALVEVQKKIKAAGGDENERAQAIELLQFQIGELEAAQIAPAETQALKEERELLRNAQTILQVFESGYDALYLGGGEGQSVLSSLQTILAGFRQVEGLSETYADACRRLEEAYYLLEECAHEVGGLKEGVVFDEQRQNEVEERIELLAGLFRKYGAMDEEALLEYKSEAEERLLQYQNAGQMLDEYGREQQQIKEAMYGLYEELSALRKKTAKALSKRMIEELGGLGMENAAFEARFEEFPEFDGTTFDAEGPDEVEFFISVNAGQPMKSLSKTASGGEISRIMLAFKNIAAKTDRIGTIVFDEIDTGISGRMAHVIARKMAEIARYHQLICVTHLPQIAAMADRNFLIEKESDRSSTHTNIVQIDGDEKSAEIARLSGGIASENSFAYAKELIENAQIIKTRLKTET